jgi:hypothetical protein
MHNYLVHRKLLARRGTSPLTSQVLIYNNRDSALGSTSQKTQKKRKPIKANFILEIGFYGFDVTEPAIFAIARIKNFMRIQTKVKGINSAARHQKILDPSKSFVQVQSEGGITSPLECKKHHS